MVCTMLSRPCYKHPFSQWHQSSSLRAFAKSSTKGAAKSPPSRHTRVQQGNNGKRLPDLSAPSSNRAWEPACRTRKSCGQGFSYVYFNSRQGPGASTCHIWGACSTSENPSSSNKALTKCWAKSASRSKQHNKLNMFHSFLFSKSGSSTQFLFSAILVCQTQASRPRARTSVFSWRFVLLSRGGSSVWLPTTCFRTPERVSGFGLARCKMMQIWDPKNLLPKKKNKKRIFHLHIL